MGIKDYLNSAFRDIVQPKTTYSVPSETIRDIFMREPLLFRNQPDLHSVILIFMDMADRIKSTDYRGKNPDIAKSYFTNPARTLPRSELGYNSDERIPASPGIMLTQYHISAQRTGFAVMLRDNLLIGAEHKQDREGCVKFAMGGYFDDNGQFTVKRIKLPETFLNPGSKKQMLKSTDIHENSVNGALYYARLCTDQLFARQSFTPEANFEKSIEHIPQQHRTPVTTAAFKI